MKWTPWKRSCHKTNNRSKLQHRNKLKCQLVLQHLMPFIHGHMRSLREDFANQRRWPLSIVCISLQELPELLLASTYTMLKQFLETLTRKHLQKLQRFWTTPDLMESNLDSMKTECSWRRSSVARVHWWRNLTLKVEVEWVLLEFQSAVSN